MTTGIPKVLFKLTALYFRHSGKLFTDGMLVYSWLKSLDERQQRAAQEFGPQSSAPAAWLHCSVGQKLEPSELENDEGKEQVRSLSVSDTTGFLVLHDRHLKYNPREDSIGLRLWDSQKKK